MVVVSGGVVVVGSGGADEGEVEVEVEEEEAVGCCQGKRSRQPILRSSRVRRAR